jgi:hypothetical protein
VVVTPEADGMGTLWALMTATDAAGAYTWLTRLARGLGKDDPRSMDARRADLLAALLNGRPVTDPDVDGDDIDEGPGQAIQPVTPGKPLTHIVMAHSTLVAWPTTSAPATPTAGSPAAGRRPPTPNSTTSSPGPTAARPAQRTGHRHSTAPHDHRPDPGPPPSSDPVPHMSDPDPPPF